MVEAACSFDPAWEEKYSRGHAQHYPWDSIVSFVFRNSPPNRLREQVRILEVGCGTASNLWFAAREGYLVAGVDASDAAIKAAKLKFDSDNLQGDLRVANFTSLPFADDLFDLVIDRCALTCAGFADAKNAISEISRVIRVGGRLYFNPYSDWHSSRSSGSHGNNGLTQDISEGSLVGVGQICFYGRRDIEDILDGWKILSLQHAVSTEMLEPGHMVHAEWRVVAEKLA